MKWSARLCFAAYEVEPFVIGTVPLVWALPFISAVAMMAVELWLVVNSERKYRGLPLGDDFVLSKS